MSTSTLAIVVSYNNAAHTLTCVESLLGQARIVVWDNASTDGTVELLSKHEVTVHASPDNLLWTPALNAAMDQYYDGEDFILFSNNDIVYRNRTVSHLKHPFGEKERVGITAPSGSSLGGMQDFAIHWPMPEGHPSMTTERWRLSRPDVRATYVVGASMMISSDVWETVGPLDNDMPLGADDHDYCLRSKEEDYQIWVVSSEYVNHVGHASYPGNQATWDEWGKKSWDAFNEKWNGYFHTEEEAIKCHWSGRHTPGWEKGTGWLSEEERAQVWATRGGHTEPQAAEQTSLPPQSAPE